MIHEENFTSKASRHVLYYSSDYEEGSGVPVTYPTLLHLHKDQHFPNTSSSKLSTNSCLEGSPKKTMAESPRDPSEITDELIRLLEERGKGDYIGESISQLEHCLQCAHFGSQSGIHPSLPTRFFQIH